MLFCPKFGVQNFKTFTITLDRSLGQTVRDNLFFTEIGATHIIQVISERDPLTIHLMKVSLSNKEKECKDDA